MPTPRTSVLGEGTDDRREKMHLSRVGVQGGVPETPDTPWVTRFPGFSLHAVGAARGWNPHP